MKKLALFLFLLCTVVGWSQSPTTTITFSTSTVATSPGNVLVTSGTQYHGIVWNRTGTLSTCSVQVDSSADGITWTPGGVIAAQVCTSNGSVNPGASVVVNFMRINVTAISGGGTINVTYNGYNTTSGGSFTGGNITGATTITVAGVASTSPLKLSGNVFTGGTGTTTVPQLLLSPSGATAETGWSTAGTFIGINTASGFTGNLMDFHINNGVQVFGLDYTGKLTAVMSSFAKQGPNVWNCGEGIANGVWADLPTCVDALVTAGGGTAIFDKVATGAGISPGGTFTRTINLGTTGTPAAPVLLALGMGVRLGCNMTAASGTEWNDCFDHGDGSGIAAIGGSYSLNGSSQPTMPQIYIMSGSHVFDVISPMDQTGQQQSMFTNGLYIIPDANSLIANAVVDEIDLYSSSYLYNVTAAPLRSVGLLIQNGDKSTLTPTSVNAAGTAITVQMAASATATPNSHHVGGTVGASGQGATSYVTVSGCSGGTAATPANANGTFHVTQLGSGLHTIADAQTAFQYTSTLSVGTGTVTGCTYKVTNSAGATTGNMGINAVIDHHNVVLFGVSSGNPNSGARPLVISANGASVALGSMIFTGVTNLENADTSKPELEINANGATSFTNLYAILFGQLHIEPYNGVASVQPGVKIVSAHDVQISAMDSAGCSSCTSGNLIDISGTNSGNINIGMITNTNWPVTINNPLDSSRAVIKPFTNNGQVLANYYFPGATSVGPVDPFMGQFNPLDASKFEIREFFCPTAAGSTFGLYGWRARFGTGAAAAAIPNPTSISTICRYQATTGATSGTQIVYQLDNGSTAPLYNLGGNVYSWDSTFIFNPGATITAGSVRVRAGFATGNTTTNIPTNGNYFRYDTDAGVGFQDTTMKLCTDSASTETCADTGLTVTASAQIKCRMWSYKSGAAVINGQCASNGVWGGNIVNICASGCTATATPYAGTSAPIFQMFNDTTTSFTFEIDRFLFTAWGLGY